MPTRIHRSSVLGAVLFFATISPATASDWRIGLGIASVSGFDDILDLHRDNLNTQGFVTETVDGLPIGVFINPYLEFDNGLGIGVGLGPAMLILGDTEFTNIPLSLDVRYSLRLGDSGLVAYLRAGVMKQITSGDFVEGDKTGSLAAIGIEWRRENAVDFGVEFATSDSEIEFENLGSGETEVIEPFAARLSFFVLF